MDSQRKFSSDGAVAKGFDQAKAVEVFELMEKFADYGFNKSHAAAYALVSYQTAYLRANYPVAFLAACMSLAQANTEKIASLRQDAMRLGISLLAPDVNASRRGFYHREALRRPARNTLRAGRDQARGRGCDGADRRGAWGEKIHGPWRISRRGWILPRSAKGRLKFSRKPGHSIRSMSIARRFFAGAEMIVRRAQAQAEERDSGQIGLFGGAEPEAVRLPNIDDWPQTDPADL